MEDKWNARKEQKLFWSITRHPAAGTGRDDDCAVHEERRAREVPVQPSVIGSLSVIRTGPGVLRESLIVRRLAPFVRCISLWPPFSDSSQRRPKIIFPA